jgi:hypothetical protein
MKWIFIVSWCAVIYFPSQTGNVQLDCCQKKEFSNKDSAMICYITQIGNSISTPVFKATTYRVKIDSTLKSSKKESK